MRWVMLLFVASVGCAPTYVGAYDVEARTYEEAATPVGVFADDGATAHTDAARADVDAGPDANATVKASDAGTDAFAPCAFRRNPITPADVNGDSYVSAIDALRIVNALNRLAQGNSVDSVCVSVLDAFVDVNGNGTVDQGDADAVIAALNAKPAQ